MNKKIGVGIVGATGWMAGALGAGVEYVAGTFTPGATPGQKHPDACVTALCDLDAERLAARQAELGFDQAELFADYGRMLASDRVDAVIVAVPNRLHAEFARQALAAGKHLFLEKPFAVTPEESRQLQGEAGRHRLVTKLDYILAHYDEPQKLRELIRQGAFGTLASTHFTYRHPINIGESAGQRWKLSRQASGGAIPMGICHALSLTVLLVDADPVEVICKNSPARCRAFDYPPQQDILITFANGVVSVVQGNIDFAEKYDLRHSVIGTAGQFDYLPFNPAASRVMWSSGPRGRAYGPDAEFAHDHLDSGDVWAHQCAATVQAFLDHVKAGQPDPLLGFASPLVRRTEAVIWAAEESAARGAAPAQAAPYLFPEPAC
ncbi:MAG: Gfo/Idh/MocA family oxidoreductase [Lentisphaeria bacterium]